MLHKGKWCGGPVIGVTGLSYWATLAADSVVLSACEAVLGRYSDGEDVASLARGRRKLCAWEGEGR